MENNYSLDNINNWKNIYTHWEQRWKEMYEDKLENNKWKTCIFCCKICECITENRFCSSGCYYKYGKLRERYRAKPRNLLKFKSDKVCEYTGTNKKILTEYFEGLFVGEMSWENYGQIWQIDHIIPMAWFDFTNKKEIQCCCNYKNLQPMFIKNNYDKHASIC